MSVCLCESGHVCAGACGGKKRAVITNTWQLLQRLWQQALRTSEAQCPPPHYTSWTIFSGGCYVVPLFWRLRRFILVNYIFLTLHTLFLKRKHTFLHSYFNHLKFFYPSPILPSIHPKTSVSEIGGMGEGRLTMAYWRSDSGVSLPVYL